MNDKLADQLADKLERIAVQLMSVVDDIRAHIDRTIPFATAQRFDAFRESKLCLHCGEPLGDELVTRGCHARCYATLMQRVGRGQATEWDLVLEGRMTPAGKGGRRRKELAPLPELTGPSLAKSQKQIGVKVSYDREKEKAGAEGSKPKEKPPKKTTEKKS